MGFAQALTGCMPTLTQVGLVGSLAAQRLLALPAARGCAATKHPNTHGFAPPLPAPPLQLLASSTVSDVQESIAMLLTCKQFEVDGAPATIRKMLPLIFARDTGAPRTLRALRSVTWQSPA